MFEKEADEFQKQIQQEYLDLGKNGAYPPLWERIGELWGKGAEFGYNKAKSELEMQIEKMKCCENCKHHYWAGGVDLCCRLRENECKDNIKLEKWEFES